MCLWPLSLVKFAENQTTVFGLSNSKCFKLGHHTAWLLSNSFVLVLISSVLQLLSDSSFRFDILLITFHPSMTLSLCFYLSLSLSVSFFLLFSYLSLMTYSSASSLSIFNSLDDVFLLSIPFFSFCSLYLSQSQFAFSFFLPPALSLFQSVSFSSILTTNAFTRLKRSKQL